MLSNWFRGCIRSFTTPASSLLYFHNTQEWQQQIKAEIESGCEVFSEFVTEEEEQRLLKEVHGRLSRLPYEESHWDDAIHLYREREQRVWQEENEAIIKRIRETAFPKDTSHLTYVHILDLHQHGRIKPHIDSVRYCGDLIAGVSLLSPCVMRLRHEKQPLLIVDLLLQRRSLYRLSGIGRYSFTHEVLGEEESEWKGQKIARDRRVSIICRDLPKHQAKLFAGLKERK